MPSQVLHTTRYVLEGQPTIASLNGATRYGFQSQLVFRPDALYLVFDESANRGSEVALQIGVREIRTHVGCLSTPADVLVKLRKALDSMPGTHHGRLEESDYQEMLSRAPEHNLSVRDIDVLPIGGYALVDCNSPSVSGAYLVGTCIQRSRI